MDVVFKIGNSVPPEQFGEYRIVDEFCIHPIFQQPHHRHYLELEFEEGRFRISSSKLAIFRIPNPILFHRYTLPLYSIQYLQKPVSRISPLLGLKTLPEPLTKRRKQIFVNYAVIAVCTMMHYAVCTLMHYVLCNMHSDALCSMHYMQW